MSTQRSQRSASLPRRAAVLAAVLACLLVIMLVGAALIENLVLRHRHSRLEGQQLQSLWLAESAVSRAAAKLQADPQYQGETWRVVVDDHSKSTGFAVIKVEAVDGQPDLRRLRIEAVYPDDPLHRVVHRQEIEIFSLPISGDSP